MQVEVSRNGRRDGRLTCPATRGEIPCGYCFSRWATGYDHLIPWSYGGTGEQSNLYPCCRRCNSILGAKIFDSLQEKREYVRNWLIERGEWYNETSTPDPMPVLQSSVPAEPPSKILLPEMPMGRVDVKESRVCSSQAWSTEAPRRWQPGTTRRCKSCQIVFECPSDPRPICETACRERMSIRREWLELRYYTRRPFSRATKARLADYAQRWLSITPLPLMPNESDVWAFSSWPDKCDICERRAHLHPKFASSKHLLIVNRVCSGGFYHLHKR